LVLVEDPELHSHRQADTACVGPTEL
jgi:hypothetical protein